MKPAIAGKKGLPVNRGRQPAKAVKLTILVGTRKGAWFLHGNTARRQWRADGPHFLGHIINHLVLDPRDGKTLIAAVSTGHLGPTIFRSGDLGKTWQEASRPPAFPKLPDGQLDANGLPGRTVKHTFWLTPGHVTQPGVWFAGTSPQAIFRTDDGGDTWQLLPGLHDNAQYRSWMGGEQDGTPDGPKLHSIIIDPRDAAHMYMAMSGGGVLGVLPGILGTLQATEALKLVLGIGEPLIGRLLIFDALAMTFDEVTITPDPECRCAGGSTADES